MRVSINEKRQVAKVSELNMSNKLKHWWERVCGEMIGGLEKWNRLMK